MTEDREPVEPDVTESGRFDEFDRVLDESSVGSPTAKAVRSLTPPNVVDELSDRIPYRPTWTVPPCETLQEWMGERGVSEEELVASSDLSADTVRRLLANEQAITPLIAGALTRRTEIPFQFWLNLQNQYDLARSALQLTAGTDTAAVCAHVLHENRLLWNSARDGFERLRTQAAIVIAVLEDLNGRRH